MENILDGLESQHHKNLKINYDLLNKKLSLKKKPNKENKKDLNLLKFSIGNAKLKKDTLIIDLPAGKT